MKGMAITIYLLFSSMQGAWSFPIVRPSTRPATRRHAVIEKTNDEWRQILSPEQYYVLREAGTEAPNSSQLNSVKEPGTFVCAGCGAPLFTTSTKYNSGTGWPSFFAPIDNAAVKTSTDFKLVVPRTEVSCATCSGHLGHVFDDGPEPTGQRYCMNGVAMNFRSNDENPELASLVFERTSQSPYRLDALQILPGVMINGILGGLFFNAFVTRLEATGIQSPIDGLPLLPALYFGVLAVRACDKLKLT